MSHNQSIKLYPENEGPNTRDHIFRDLKPRQREVVDLLLTGLTSKEIGSKLGVVEKTIKYHLTLIYKKLGVRSRMGLTLKLMGKDSSLVSDAQQAICPLVQNKK